MSRRFLSGFRLPSGAGAGKVLTSDANGEGTWVAPASANHDVWSTTHPDVDTADARANGDVLTWDGPSGKWKATAPSGGGGSGNTLTPSFMGLG